VVHSKWVDEAYFREKIVTLLSEPGVTPFWRNLYLGRGTIQRWCDRIRDDFISLGSAGVPDQSQEAKRCRILRLKSQPRQVKGN
jgi:hypothetical protein